MSGKRSNDSEHSRKEDIEDNEEENEMGEFEDDWEDDVEEEVEEEYPTSMAIDEQEGDDDEEGEGDDGMQGIEEEEDEENQATEVYLPGQALEEGEELEVDNSAYDMLHSLNVEWPCLSFDIINQPLADGQSLKFPLTTYVVAGTQADQASKNKIVLVKMSQLRRTKHDDDSDDEVDLDDAGSDTEDDPVVESRAIKHQGAINRIRVAPQRNNIVATWSDTAKVHIWDTSLQLSALDEISDSSKVNSPLDPLYTFEGHSTEGFALDWSLQTPGRIVTGDCKKHIYVWNPQSSGSWNVDKVPYKGHTDSVEDLQWSPSETDVFASCSVDQTVKVWDARKKQTSALSVHAHTTDVNVISWNKVVQYLLVSGGDDGSFKIWDLRMMETPAAEFKWHTSAITSVEWHPEDGSVLAVSGADDQVTLWDLSVERDEETATNEAEVNEVPPQLLFIHQGQNEIKEIHWHKQHPGVLLSTAASGFNIFKTISA